MRTVEAHEVKVGDAVWTVPKGVVNVRAGHWQKVTLTEENIAIITSKRIMTR